MKGLFQKIAIIALFCANVNALAQPLLQEKRIYLVDVTASMEGRGAVATPNIFDSVKDKLESTISHIADETTEVSIIPFTSKTFPEYSRTIAQKDSLISIISKLEVKRGDTNIADAWSKAVSCLDSTKINYIFLLTDGLHNCGPSKEELFSRLEEWGCYSQGKYYFAFYVMLTPNAKEQEICRIVDATPNIWLIESMDIDASLVKTNASIRKNVFNDNSVSVYFSSNNNDVELSQVGLDISVEDNPYYEIESISKSIMTDSYQLRLREKKEKIEMPLVDTLLFRISHNSIDYPFVFFTPDYFSAIISNQGPRCLKLTNHNVLNKLDAKIKFGKLKFHEPFQGPFKYLREYLEPTLNYPPFSWLRPDTLSVSTQLYLTFNEEAVRSSSNLSFILKDSDNAWLPDVELTCDNWNIITATNTEEKEVNCSIKVLPGRESGLISGPFILHTSNLDSVNEKEITSDDEIICEWSVNYKRKWALLLWLLWIVCAVLAFIIVYFAIRIIIKAFITLIKVFRKMNFKILDNIKKYNNRTEIPEMYANEYGFWKNDNSYKLNPDYVIPNGNQSKNTSQRTSGETGKLLHDYSLEIEFKNGYPIFDKDGGTKDGKPLFVELNEGILGYLKESELRSKTSVNREKLHIEVFKRMAEKYGMSYDELQVFKGNSEPVMRLAQKWGCSEKAVWKRCGNPHKINRVLHEQPDCKTVVLVPWLYHHVDHDGGIEKLKSSLKN